MAEITKFVLVNRSLAMIGEDAMQSLGPETPGGQKADLLYDAMLDFCIGLYNWTFLRQTVELNRLATVAPVNGHAHAHQLPGNLPVNRFLRSKDADDVILKFEIEGDQFHCGEERVYAQVITDKAPHLWSGTFRAAFCKALAGELAAALAHDKGMQAAMMEEAFGSPSLNFRGGLMGAAIQADSRQAPVRALPWSNPLLDAWNS